MCSTFVLLLALLCIDTSTDAMSVWLDPYKTLDLTHAQDENALGFPSVTPFERKVAYKQYIGVPGQW